MKYKVGDKVRVVSQQQNSMFVNQLQYLGQIVTISKAELQSVADNIDEYDEYYDGDEDEDTDEDGVGGYEIEEDDGQGWWYEEEFEGLVESTSTDLLLTI